MVQASTLTESVETSQYGGVYTGPARTNAAPMEPPQRAQDAMNRAFEKGQHLQRDLETSVDGTVSDGESNEF